MFHACTKIKKHQTAERCIFKNKRNRGRVVGDNILDKELQVRNIRAVDIVVLVDNEVAYKASIRGLLKGDETIALANLGWWVGLGG